MPRIPQDKQSALAELIKASGSSPATKLEFEAALTCHGRIPRSLMPRWQELLDECIAGGNDAIANRARQLFGGEVTADALKRRARFFIPAEAAQEPSPAEVANAWLWEIDVVRDKRVRVLTPNERDTLARIAAWNKGHARTLVVSSRIEAMASLEQLLDHVRVLMEAGVHAWQKFFTVEGILSKKKPVVARAVSSLKQLAIEAGNGRMRDAIRVKVSRDVPWDALPNRLVAGLHKKFSPLLTDAGKTFGDVARSVVVDCYVEGDRVISITDMGSNGFAFPTNRGRQDPVHFVRQQLLAYKLMAIAVADGLQGVEIVLHNSRKFDERWAAQIEQLAMMVDKDFMITHVPCGSDVKVPVFGSPFMRANTPMPAAPSQLPPLKPPANPKRQTPIPAAKLVAKVVAPPGLDAGGDHAAWVNALLSEAFDVTSPVHQLLGWARATKSLEMPAGFHDEVQSLVSSFLGSVEEYAEHVAELERRAALVETALTEDVPSLDDLDGRHARMELDLRGIARGYSEREIGWGQVDRMISIIHPDARASVMDDIEPRYDNAFKNFCSLDERIAALRVRIERQKKMMAQVLDGRAANGKKNGGSSGGQNGAPVGSSGAPTPVAPSLPPGATMAGWQIGVATTMTLAPQAMPWMMSSGLGVITTSTMRGVLLP